VHFGQMAFDQMTWNYVKNQLDTYFIKSKVDLFIQKMFLLNLLNLLSFVMLSVVMLCVVMLSVIMLSVIMLGVMAPFIQLCTLSYELMQKIDSKTFFL
jgi:hypothetical protein